MTQDEIDARRYRWLRERGPWHSSPGGHVSWANYRNGRYDGTSYPTGEALDAAIDAAMADEPRYTITAKGREMLKDVR